MMIVHLENERKGTSGSESRFVMFRSAFERNDYSPLPKIFSSLLDHLVKGRDLSLSLFQYV